jgi:hypothetical protein
MPATATIENWAVAEAGLVTPTTSLRKYRANVCIVVNDIKIKRRETRNQTK